MATEPRNLHVAVAGCSHGEMDMIYGTLAEIENQKGFKFDILLCCGDYQAIRNYGDLAHMHVSDKFKQLNTFYKYYNGEKVSPILTVFIGGNHESSGYMQELPNGGWVAKNIYYMGHVNVIQFAGLRIGGLSGIFKYQDFDKGRYERPPFEGGSKISAYHVRNIDILRMKSLSSDSTSTHRANTLDIMLSHDWPSGITDFGDKDALLRIKPYFAEDIQRGNLGNPHTMKLLYDIRPAYWFAAHLHCKFAAIVTHKKGADDEEPPQPTRFLSLDKPVIENSRRQFVQALEIPAKNDRFQLEYDPVWLTILRLTDSLTRVSSSLEYMPNNKSMCERSNFFPSDEEVKETLNIFGEDMKIPENFRHTAPPLKDSAQRGYEASLYYKNPQSTEFCSRLQIQCMNTLLCAKNEGANGIPHYLIPASEEIVLPDDDDEEEAPTAAEADSGGVDGLFAIDTDTVDFVPPPFVPNAQPQVQEVTSTSGPELKRRRVDDPEDDA